MSAYTFIAAGLLFLLGLWLSAFFSGNETGFYRISFLRLNLDAHKGDRIAGKLLWFSQNPSYFVATTLVGNNVANYLTTLAIGLATVAVVRTESGWIEIASTLLMSPVIFIFGELVPKNLYYRAPYRRLRRDANWFAVFYRIFLPVSFPLIWVAKLFEHVGGSPNSQIELVLGRKRLVQVLSQGHREGLITDVQSRLIDGLMHTASQPVTDSLTPSDRVLGLEETASREEVIKHARSYGLTSVALKHSGSPDDWYGYVRVVDVTLGQGPITKKIRSMPVINASESKLQALLKLKTAGEKFGLVRDGEKVLGIVSELGLVEQTLRPAHAVGVRHA